jgi:hypothetical protein
MNTSVMVRSAFRKAPFLGWFAVGLLTLSGLLLVFGWSKSGPTVAGVVKVDGEPLAKGSISFVSVDGRGPGGGDIIKEGRYRIEKGLTVGKYRVEIQGTRRTQKKVADTLVPADQVLEEAAVVPLEFNRNSTLFKEVRAGHNPIDFELPGIKKSR